MFELLIIVIIFVLLMLAIIWGHFLANKSPTTDALIADDVREDTNVALYKEHKAEIEKDFSEGNIDEENYQYLLAELDKSLLQDLEQNEQSTTIAPRKLNIVWPLSLTVFILAFSLVMYSKQGAYKDLSQPRMQHAQQNEGSPQDQLHDQLKQLLEVTKANPENAEAWYSLGQLYVGAGQFDNALIAFDKVIAIEGIHADLLGAKAQAMYYGAQMKLTPEVQSLIDRALSLDALDPSTNILLGMHHFMNQSYQQAIEYWQKVIDSGRTSVNVEALTSAVNDAKERLSLTGVNNEVEVESGPQLTLDVSLSEEVLEQVSQGEDKVVFVYAVPADGGRMPVAAVKLRASDLPTQVVLNNARAMSPQMNLSSVNKVNVFAIVSKLGGAGIKSGDFKGELVAIDVNTVTTLPLIINTLVE